MPLHSQMQETLRMGMSCCNPNELGKSQGSIRASGFETYLLRNLSSLEIMLSDIECVIIFAGQLKYQYCQIKLVVYTYAYQIN